MILKQNFFLLNALFIITLSSFYSSFSQADSCKKFFSETQNEFDPSNLDLYARLGLSKDATQKEIAKAYRKAAIKYHPDSSQNPGSAADFRNIQEAYETLSDNEARHIYDVRGSTNSEQKQSSCASGPCGYASHSSMMNWGEQHLREVTEKFPSLKALTDLEMHILTQWLTKGDKAVNNKFHGHQSYTAKYGYSFSEIVFPEGKVRATGLGAKTVIHEMGERKQIKDLIEYLETAKAADRESELNGENSPVGTYWYVQMQAIYELSRIYKNDPSSTVIPQFFERYIILHQDRPRDLFIILSGLEGVQTLQARSFLLSVVANKQGWAEGRGSTYQNWTGTLKLMAEKLLSQFEPQDVKGVPEKPLQIGN